MMDDTELDALATAARAATQGDRSAEADGTHHMDIWAGSTIIGTMYLTKDANFAVAASSDAVLRLIERLRAAEADAARFRHIIAGAEHFPDPEPRPEKPAAWGWSIQWGCWTAEGTDIRAAIDAAMKDRGSPPLTTAGISPDRRE